MHRRLRLTKLPDGRWELLIKNKWTMYLTDAEKSQISKRLKTSIETMDKEHFLRKEFKTPESLEAVIQLLEDDKITLEEYSI